MSFFSKIFGVQIKKWQKKNILQKRTENRNIRYLCKTEQQNRTKAYAGESEEDNVSHTRGILSYRTNETDSCKSGVSLIDDYRIRD